VGAGVTGALVAHALIDAGIDTIALDKRSAGGGSTAASTALLLYELDTPLRELSVHFGQARAARAYEMGVEAIRRLEGLTSDFARELGNDCGFERRPSLYLASHSVTARGLREECTLRQRHGIAVELLSDRDIASRYPFSAPAALLSRDAAQVDPLRLTRSLLESATARGLRLYEHTEVTGYDTSATAARVSTATGHRVTAQRIVFATGYEALPYVGGPSFGGTLADIRTTYAFASEPVGTQVLEKIGRWRDRCLIWETARPYLYVRTTPDGRVLVGGEDDDATDRDVQLARIPGKVAHLTARFTQLFPDVKFEVHSAWAGIFESSHDGLPFIGSHPDYPRACFALGYGGNGITFAVMAADILRDVLAGRGNPDAALFGFNR